MKNLLMILFVFAGFGITQLAAQSCCQPCPPACCVQGKSAGTAKGTANAACTPEQMKNCTPEEMKNCTPEQLKACGMGNASGKSCAGSKSAAVPAGRSQVATTETKSAVKKTGI